MSGIFMMMGNSFWGDFLKLFFIPFFSLMSFLFFLFISRFYIESVLQLQSPQTVELFYQQAKNLVFKVSVF